MTNREYELRGSDLLLHVLGLGDTSSNILLSNNENQDTVTVKKTFFYPGVETGELFVYCDIIEHSYVGRDKRPLLRIVTLNGDSPVINKCITFQNLQYIPVSLPFISSVSVDLKNIWGDPFPIQTGHVIHKLHFRRVVGE